MTVYCFLLLAVCWPLIVWFFVVCCLPFVGLLFVVLLLVDCRLLVTCDAWAFIAGWLLLAYSDYSYCCFLVFDCFIAMQYRCFRKSDRYIIDSGRFFFSLARLEG